MATAHACFMASMAFMLVIGQRSQSSSLVAGLKVAVVDASYPSGLGSESRRPQPLSRNPALCHTVNQGLSTRKSLTYCTHTAGVSEMFRDFRNGSFGCPAWLLA
jgi:hypothetical protein